MLKQNKLSTFRKLNKVLIGRQSFKKLFFFFLTIQFFFKQIRKKKSIPKIEIKLQSAVILGNFDLSYQFEAWHLTNLIYSKDPCVCLISDNY